MGRVLLCVGRYAERPYFMERAYVQLYSIEELCYCFIHNAYLIGEEILDGRLTEWLKKECGLEELAGMLLELQQEGAAGEYAERIMEYAGYGSRQEIRRVREILNEDRDLGLYEKRKARADHLMQHGKYLMALKSYTSLLEEIPLGERELRARVFHNRGVSYAGLFRFEEAARDFERASEWGGGEASMIGWLAARRMTLEETSYLNFLASHPEADGYALKVEELLRQAEATFEGTEKSRMLFTLRVSREEQELVSYQDEIEKLLCSLKNRYREITSEQ